MIKALTNIFYKEIKFMKKILSIIVALMTVLMMVACAGNANNDGSFGKGKVMALEFETNPSTGYSWEYKFKNGTAEIVFDREENKINENLDVVGSPNKIVYYFRATKEGNTNLVFTYRRPWEGGDIAYDVVYELAVDKDLNIRCLSKMKGEVESDKDLSFFPNPTFLNE